MWRSSVDSHSHASCSWVCQESVLRWPGRDIDVSRTSWKARLWALVVIVEFSLSTYISICMRAWMCNPECVCAGVCILGGRTCECKNINPWLEGHKKREKEMSTAGWKLCSWPRRHSPPQKAFCQNNWESCKDNFPMEPKRMLGQRDKRHAS